VVIDNRIIEIDLSEQVGSGLEFAWTGRGKPFSGTETAAGVTTTEVTTQIAWANGALYNSTATANMLSGYVKTGFHRFATLEPKRFDSVRVNMDGTSGTVEVIRVDASGAELSLFTLDVAQTHVEEIPLLRRVRGDGGPEVRPHPVSRGTHGVSRSCSATRSGRCPTRHDSG
jgi:hypothetical protein